MPPPKPNSRMNLIRCNNMKRFLSHLRQHHRFQYNILRLWCLILNQIIMSFVKSEHCWRSVRGNKKTYIEKVICIIHIQTYPSILILLLGLRWFCSLRWARFIDIWNGWILRFLCIDRRRRGGFQECCLNSNKNDIGAPFSPRGRFLGLNLCWYGRQMMWTRSFLDNCFVNLLFGIEFDQALLCHFVLIYIPVRLIQLPYSFSSFIF